VRRRRTGEGIRRIRLHGDCHPGNILWTPKATCPAPARTLSTWTTPAAARPCRTCGCCWAANGAADPQLSALLDGYEELRDFDRRELALIEPLRTLRLMHYSAWMARRWDDPIFPINFPWFGSRDYWQGQVDMLVEQIEEMQNAALVV
jgi:Ser/Thr protein kinase RdoA (MazF antagonist)